jgi:hypothetical protein
MLTGPAARTENGDRFSQNLITSHHKADPS